MPSAPVAQLKSPSSEGGIVLSSHSKVHVEESIAKALPFQKECVAGLVRESVDSCTIEMDGIPQLVPYVDFPKKAAFANRETTAS